LATEDANCSVPTSKVENCARDSRGEFLSAGASGILKRLPSGDVIKSPWPGAREEDCRRDITTESKIYNKLGVHPRLVQIVGWDPNDCLLTMEYATNGSLKDFLLTRNDEISVEQRLKWVQEAVEGLQLLHDADVIHCDIEPRNFLLDANLDLKIADFGGSSFQGSQPSAYAGVRFLPPNFVWPGLYHIRHYPFAELESDEVEANYRANKFPELEGIICGNIIKQCWSFEIESAKKILEIVQ